jgi:hypothetical protein
MNHLGFVIACVAGWVNRHQQHVLEYLQEEVRAPKGEFHVVQTRPQVGPDSAD